VQVDRFLKNFFGSTMSALIFHRDVSILQKESLSKSWGNTLNIVIYLKHPHVVELLLFVKNQVLKFVCEIFKLKLLTDVY
jgi:hypothetical protein